MKEFISSAANTLVPALLVLRAKGFQVHRSKVVGQEEEWAAETSEVKFIAEDVATLPGLQTMHENRRPNWKATDAEMDAFFKEFPRSQFR